VSLPRFRSQRERTATIVGIPATLVAVVGFVYWVFPPLFEASWNAACGATGTWLVCSTFLQHGFTAGILIGLTAPLVGAYLVNRQMALIGEALAHTAFGGVAIGLFIGASVEWANYPLLWALVVAAVAALGMQYLAVTTDAYADVPLAIVLTGSFALGIAVISYGDGIAFGREIESYLWGNILFVPFENVQLMVGLALVVLGMVALTHKQLLFITFDREAARLARINVWFYDTVLIVVTALVVVAAMQILGAILVAAMLVVPVAAAMQLTSSFNRGLVLSVVFGEFAVIAGILVSYWLDVATGAAIVLVAIAVYIVTVLGGR
jgi:zinc transport system permease protein